MEYTRDMIERAKMAKTTEEFVALAQAEGIALTPEDAAELFQKLNAPVGELDDSDLDNVAGGGCGGSSGGTQYVHVRGGSGAPCPRCECNVWQSTPIKETYKCGVCDLAGKESLYSGWISWSSSEGSGARVLGIPVSTIERVRQMPN